MSTDPITEVTHESWFSRIGGAIKGILVGLVLFVVAFPLLFWNEGRAVKRYKTIKEGGGAVISVASDEVLPANAGKLIHISGKANTEATLTDPVFGVSANALKLRRFVEMYQWKESTESQTEKKLGGGTETTKTTTYGKVWSDKSISSAKFKESAGHQNPDALPFESTDQTADVVTLGAFTLSPSLIRSIKSYEALSVGKDVPLVDLPGKKVRLFEGGFYIGADPAAPQIGDVRIIFKVVKPTEVSVIAKQVGNTFEPYRAKAGGSLELLETGVCTAEAMIQAAQDSNRMLTWILRLVGYVVMLVGLNMIFKVVSVLADVLPMLGSIVRAGTGLIAFLLAAILSLITIAVAWIVFRPILGLILIVAAVGLTFAIKGKLKSSKAAS